MKSNLKKILSVRGSRVSVRKLMIVAGMSAAVAGASSAATLRAGPDQPLILHILADGLLYLHIAGGAVGILSGTAAILSRKGSPIHRRAGQVFFVAMFVAYAIGAGVAPFLSEGQRPNFVAGILALYLLVTAWLAAKRRDPVVGPIEYGGLATALLITAAGALFMWQGANDPSGTVDGSPPQAFTLFIVAGAVAVLGEIHVIWRRAIRGTARIARHLWRMCLSMFLATGSFFLGQEHLLPEWMRGTLWQTGPVIFPLAAIAIWMVLVHLPRRRTRPAGA